jgi:hypothetical protein
VDAAQIVTLSIAAGGLILGVVNSVVQIQTYRRDKTGLTVDTGFGRLTSELGISAGLQMVYVTATNTGRHPVSVTGMAFDATVKRFPLLAVQPGSAVPTLLQPGEHTTMWIESEKLAASLRNSGQRLVRAVVSGPGQQRWTNGKLRGVAGLGRDNA